MKKTICLTILLFIPLSLPVYSSEEKNAELKAEAMTIVKKFAGSLKPRLKAAMQSGGPVTAVKVCSVEAPAVAKQLGEETGWQISRVSLKPRNSKTAVADKWEQAKLIQFGQQQKRGEPVSKMVSAERTDNTFRFMKAQVVEGLCLNCHGQNISTDVKNTLQQYYPNDNATGYSLGDIRGAFSLSKEL